MRRSILIMVVSSILLVAGCGDLDQTSGVAAEESAEVKVAWNLDYERAGAESAGQGRPMLMNFTGSNWCVPCKRMKADALETERFAQYAEENLVLLELDFPRRIEQPEHLVMQNRRLADEFRIEGFPTFILVAPDGTELGRTVGYLRGGPTAFVAWIESLRAKQPDGPTD